MSYDTRKSLPGQEFVEEIEFILDRCRYTDQEFIDNQYLDVVIGEPPGYVGDVVVENLSPSFMSFWGVGVELYARVENTGEIILFEIVDAESILISPGGRGKFGSFTEFLTGKLKIIHQGEADGSCRGFPHTCSNTDSYSPNSKYSMKFCTSQLAGGTHRFAGLYHKACDHDVGEVDVGESIGQRSRLRFRIQDQRHDDFYVVPYPDRRSSAGTLFGKMLARHPYFVGREVIYREGYRDAGTFSEPEWIERRFIIDDAKLSNEYFTVTALDPLVLTEDKKAKMPVPSPAILAVNIDTDNDPFTYVDAPDYYFGSMSAFVYVRIDSEVIYCQVTGAKQLTPITRAYRSEAKEHEAGASIQDCVAYQGTNGIDAIVDALVNCTSIPAEFIGDYSAVKALLPSFILEDAIISKPIPVIDFINSLIKLGNLIMYYHEIKQEIVINYIPELSAEPVIIDESEHIERESVSTDDNIKNQWTRFQHLWAPVDITKDTEENYAIRYMAVNIDLESQKNLGQTNEKKPFKNMLLSNSANDSLIGTAYASRVIEQTELPPKIANFKINAAFVGDVNGVEVGLGSIINLSTKESQDKDGNPIADLYQILKLSGNGYQDYDVKARRYQALQPDEVDFVLNTSAENFVLSDVFAPAAGSYTVYINPDVIFGSTSASSAAFDTGSQSPGVSIRLVNRGKILGMGGRGGNCEIGGGSNPSPAEPGQNGGPAINATVDMEIDNGAGLIWAGGGGGAGEEMKSVGPGYFTAAAGGGGGQGYGVARSGFYSNGGYFEDLDFDGIGRSGNQSSPGETGGGEWGKPGVTHSAAGGLAGEAIKSNGNTVTIVSGDNEFNIRGRRT